MELYSIFEIASIFILVYAVVLFQSYFFCKFSGKNLEYNCYFSTYEAFEGDELFIIETICNRKKLPIPWLKAELNTSKWLDFAGPKSVVTHNTRFVTSNFLLKGGQKITRKWPLKCLKRGVYSIDSVMLVWGDLLGIKSAGVHIPVNTKLIVYPSPADLGEILPNNNYLLGNIIVKRWINEDPFILSGVRNYQFPDPMNRINWLATARSGELMVKKYDYTSQPTLAIILNIQSTEFDFENVLVEGTAELGIRIAAAVVERAIKSSLSFKFATNAPVEGSEQKQCTFISEGLGLRHGANIFECLARLELKIIRDFDTFLDDIQDFVIGADTIFITPYVNNKINSAMKSIKSRGNNAYIIPFGNI